MEGKKFLWMLKKDLLSLWRHKPRLVSIMVFPILMIVLFGYGMGGSIENVPIAIVDQSHGETADMTLMSIKNMSLFEIKNITSNVQDAKEMVDRGEVKAAIILPSNYDNITDPQAKTVVLYLDSSDQIAGQTIVPAAQMLFSEIGAKISSEKLVDMNPNLDQATSLQVENSTNSSAEEDSSPTSVISSSLSGIVNTVNLQVNRLYGEIEYIDFLVPAILAMTLMMSCMMGMGQSIAGERETGELARLFMTPTSVATVVGGKIMSKLTIETIRAMVLLVTAILLFGITINGNIFLAILLLILGALCFVGFGMMISATAQSQEDYTQMVMPFTMPMMFVSGVFYPIETMPWIFQKIAYICPLTYLNDAMRGVMLKGAGIGDIWIDIAVLAGFTLLFFALGVVRFNRDV
ncbi:ABC transporter permease [Methanobrevibacter filiformis]|uniref:Inner membrane transport permease YbhR n=1 Tax=Methanobrevibacter filiformis TaxID=55758 RepID=A0A166DXF9_9EURY|nr:ABC transporter permease [Methanobrevibacter filiformis]KZX16054.1 inner membrane transport permease YbhR [Methanobrevibacter filiformis]